MHSALFFVFTVVSLDEYMRGAARRPCSGSTTFLLSNARKLVRRSRRRFISPLLSLQWAGVGVHYHRDPNDLIGLLPKMAAAHILDDLESVLFFIDVEDEEYDCVSDDIDECLRSVEFASTPDERAFHGLFNSRLVQAVWAPGIWAFRMVVLEAARELRSRIGYGEQPPRLEIGEWETKARAERIWEQSGYTPGMEELHWFAAQAELKDEKRQSWMNWYEKERRRLADFQKRPPAR